METLTNPEFWASWLSIVLIDLTLAGDNALVIALAVRSLPAKQQIWGRIWGTVGAVSLRVAFIAVVTQLLKIPLLQCIGGLVLIWIALKLVRPAAADHGEVRHGTSLYEAIRIIVVADIVMSLDNVVAIAGAAHGDMRLVVFGLILSLPLVVWGSGLLASLMNRFGWIIWVGGGVLGYVAGKMIFHDHLLSALLGRSAVGQTIASLEQPLAIALAVVIALIGWNHTRQSKAGTMERLGQP